MRASTRVSTITVHELRFSVDGALKTTTEVDVQRSMECVAVSCANYGLTINMDKTVVLHTPQPSVDYKAPLINAKGVGRKNLFVDDHPYHGSSTTRCPAALTRRHHRLYCDPPTVQNTDCHGHHISNSQYA
ncbi:unnamed protein product [Dibothriocephalus latus]|uniref:Reverse transcriptase domain-containing protein n=1 Tax=Dibothriocephalus latus TaxID=60516 RepID=A0A3P7P1M0_DIBLA|nr:unnamed protein product [Dibothriocephalus latus]